MMESLKSPNIKQYAHAYRDIITITFELSRSGLG